MTSIITAVAALIGLGAAAHFNLLLKPMLYAFGAMPDISAESKKKQLVQAMSYDPTL